MDNDDKQLNDAPLQSNQEEDKGEVTPKQDPSDNLTPDHPRFKQVLEDNKEFRIQNEQLQQKLEAIEAKISQRQQETGIEELTPEEASAIEKIDHQMKARGYMTKDEFQQELRVEKVAGNISRLAERHNGQDGMPKFVPEEVVAYAKANGYGDNLDAAYNSMHFDTIVAIKAKKMSNTPQAPDSEKPTGGEERNAPGLEITPETIASMDDSEWAQKGPDILAAIKQNAK